MSETTKETTPCCVTVKAAEKGRTIIVVTVDPRRAESVASATMCCGPAQGETCCDPSQGEAGGAPAQGETGGKPAEGESCCK